MNNFYWGGRGMCPPDDTVETQYLAPLQKIYIPAIRRSERYFARHTWANHYLSLPLLLLVFMCLRGLTVQGQSPENEGGDKNMGVYGSIKLTRETVSKFVTIKDVGHKQKLISHYSPTANLKKYPLFEYKAKGDFIEPIIVGEHVPDEIWDLPLRIVNDVDGQDSTTLRDLAKDKILIIDFWATWCKPCLISMDKWKTVESAFPDQFQVVGLMMDYDYKAELTLAERGWDMPQIIGPEVYLLNYYFMGTPIVGPSAWIHQGLHLGVTPTRNDNESLLKTIVTGQNTLIPEENRWKGLKL